MINEDDALTVYVAIVGHGVDFLVRQNLHMLAAGSTVKLVGPDESTADPVRHPTLLTHMLCKIRRGLNGYLSEIKYHIINTCKNSSSVYTGL